MTALSVVVPSYNGSKKLPLLAEVLQKQLKSGDECLVVDDASSDETAQVAADLGFKVLSLPENHGVGYARNWGAKHAQHEILVFFDDDVWPEEGFLDRVRELFTDPALECCQGPHVLEPADQNPNLWQKIEALLWTHRMMVTCVNPQGECHSLYSQSFCIRRPVFLEIGGFSEGFSGAGGEEFEISKRLMDQSRIVYQDDLRSAHHYQSLFPRLKTLFKRSANFSSLYQNMDPDWQKAHRAEVQRCVLAVLIVFFSLLTPFISVLGWVLVFLLLCFVLSDMALLKNCRQWGRLSYFPALIFQCIVQYMVIALGTALSMFRNQKAKVKADA